MRLSATKALLSRRDTIVVATVSAIYGLGAPEDYLSLRLILSRGEHIDQRDLIKHLTQLQYTRNEYELHRGTFRVKGEVIDVFPAESEIEALRIEPVSYTHLDVYKRQVLHGYSLFQALG